MSAAILSAPRRVLPEYDEVLVWAVLALLAIGLVMVYSASIATAEGSKFTGFRPSYYLMRHGAFITVGLLAGLFAFQVPVMWLIGSRLANTVLLNVVALAVAWMIVSNCSAAVTRPRLASSAVQFSTMTIVASAISRAAVSRPCSS